MPGMPTLPERDAVDPRYFESEVALACVRRRGIRKPGLLATILAARSAKFVTFERYFRRKTMVVSVSDGSGVGSPYTSHV
jgi:hypothetical protein